MAKGVLFPPGSTRMRYVAHGCVCAMILLALAACDRRAWYEGMQASQRQQCQRLPPAEARDCEAKSSGSYDRYERERSQY